MNLPTWDDLLKGHCHRERYKVGGKDVPNPRFEELASRRYNFSAISDSDACRLVFLKPVLEDPSNKTLVRKGRFIWCRNFRYEGVGSDKFRRISFTIDKGSKRFFVSERNVLCVPSKNFINNNRYFAPREKTFRAFSSVFAYKNALSLMAKGSGCKVCELVEQLQTDNPFKPGTLVAPRLGYFYPQKSENTPGWVYNASDLPPDNSEHPCGIILGKSFSNDDYYGREFYRVKFSHMTYESLHPVQLEILNEV